MMAEQTISNNLQLLLKLQGDLSLSDLSRKTGIPQPTLHHIIEGKTKNPRKNALQKLANFFSISVPQLIGELPLSNYIPNTIKESFNISTVPIINWELAKNWDKTQNTSKQFDEIIIEREINENCFALLLNNATMEPIFQEGSILVFDPSKNPQERDFILVYLEKSNSIAFNRLFIENNHYYLKQYKTNGDVELIKLHIPNDKILAVLIEARLKF
ncbi:MAG TPA: LexA family transcriptional regulator [Legionellaceae bacterium]|nr:LexA family transcriptional regulator [Legionellaceae bacterium]